MKKIITILITVCLVAGAGFGLYTMLKPKQTSPMEILPKDPVFFMHAKDVEKSIREFMATPFWQKISEIDYQGLLEKGGLKRDQIPKWDEIETRFSMTSTKYLLKKFFGKEFAVAVYPTNMTSFDIVAVQQMASNIFIVTRLQPEAQFAEFISQFFQDFGDEVTTRQEEYWGHTITIVTIGNLKIDVAYTQLDDLLVFGIGKNAAQSCVDVLEKKKSALSAGQNFQKVKTKFLKPSNVQGFWDIGEFALSLKEQAKKAMMAAQQAEGTDDFEKQIEESFRNLDGFTSLGYSSSMGAISKSRYTFFYDKSLLSQDLLAMYSCSAIHNNSAEFVPSDVMYYQWNNCYKFDSIWEQAKKEMENTPTPPNQQGTSPEQIIAGIEAFLQMSIENDLLPALGDEIGGYIADLDLSGAFPMPEFTLFVKVANKDTITSLLDRLTNNPLVPFQSENYSNTTIHYVLLPIGGSIEPAYSFLGNYFLISSSRQLIKKSIDAKNDKSQSIVSNAYYSESTSGLLETNNGVSFIDLGKTTQKAREFLEWGNSWSKQSYLQNQAFYAGSLKKLQELNEDIEINKAKLEELKKNLEAKKYQGSQDEITQIEQNIEETQKFLDVDLERLPELEAIVGDLKQPVDNSDLYQFYLDELIYPFLEAYGTFKAMNTRTQYGDGVLDMMSYLLR